MALVEWVRQIPISRYLAQTYTQRFEVTATVQSNAALIKSGYDAFARGDIQGAFAVFAEDILWHIPGRGPLSRDYRGHAEVLGFFQHFMELSHGTFRIQVDDILAKGDRVVVLCTESAQRGDRSWSSPQVHVWTSRMGEPASSGSTKAISRRKTSSGRRGSSQKGVNAWWLKCKGHFSAPQFISAAPS